MNCPPEIFMTGQPVPASGLYAVKHSAHRLFSQVALFKGELFPRCANCSGAVAFCKVREFSGLDAAGAPQFRIPLYELAVLEPDTEALSA